MSNVARKRLAERRCDRGFSQSLVDQLDDDAEGPCEEMFEVLRDRVDDLLDAPVLLGDLA